MGTSGTKDCLGASKCVLNVSTDGAFTITPGSVFQYGTTSMLKGIGDAGFHTAICKS